MPAGAVTITLDDFDGNTDPSVSSASSGDVLFTGQAILTTGSGAVAHGVSETDLGLSNNTIRKIYRDYIEKPGFSSGSDPTEGSALQITFSGDANDMFRFDWNMTSSEPSRSPLALDVFTDFAWYSITGPPGAQNSDEGVLSHVNDGSSPPGPQMFTFTLPTTGTYTVTIGVHDVDDTNFDSSFFLDFFRLVRAPEPGTFGSVASGLIALSWLSRRRNR